MTEKSYLYLLIICIFVCHGIVASLSVDIRNSAEFLVRNRRVINHEPNGHELAKFTDINYIVNIRYRNYTRCVGAILSASTVISASSCFLTHLWEYQVNSGSGYVQRSTAHKITSKIAFYGNPSHRVPDGIALIRVDPFFTFRANTFLIRLHVEPVLPGELATVSGWGCNHPTSSRMAGTPKLRTITVPIMNHRECVMSYVGRYYITDKHICTFNEQKLCAINDIGTPLVIDKLLVGIHVHKGEEKNKKNPDIFLNVQDPVFSTWIREHI